MAFELYLKNTVIEKRMGNHLPLCASHTFIFPSMPLRFAEVLGSPVHFISTSAMNEANCFNQLGYIWVMCLGEKAGK